MRNNGLSSSFHDNFFPVIRQHVPPEDNIPQDIGILLLPSPDHCQLSCPFTFDANRSVRRKQVVGFNCEKQLLSHALKRNVCTVMNPKHGCLIQACFFSRYRSFASAR